MERITDSDGKRFFTREFENNDIAGFQKHLLAISASECFLPMHFIESTDRITAFYRTDGFVSLNEWLSRQEWISDEPATVLCRMFSMILRRLMEAEDMFLDLDALILDVASTYVHGKGGYVKLAYQSRYGTSQTLQKSYLSLLQSTTAIVNDEQWNVYSEEIQRQAAEENLGLSGLLMATTAQSRSILERKWPEREHFRA